MRSKALNRAFNRALIDQGYRQKLLTHMRRTLHDTGVPEAEICSLEAAAPRDIREFAQALERMHSSSF